LTLSQRAWRLLVDPPADGAWNMAVDEAVLEGYADGPIPPPPTLRLYGWRPAALSLGRFQRAAGSHDPVYLRENGIDLVRRPTGGAAVLHEHERTYAVVARLRSDPFPGGVTDTYRRVALALNAALRRIGLSAQVHEPVRLPERSRAACFDTTAAREIAVGGLKLVGSAQLRRRRAFLQHGSILLRADPRRLARAIGLEEPPVGYTDLARSLGHVPHTPALDRALVAGFEEAFSATLTLGGLTAGETQRATRLRAWKYHATSWTLDGRPPGS
jgi:lipoate-protein ligase A